MLSLLLILVVANAALHSGENPLNPIAAAAGRTEDVHGLHFAMKVVTTSEANPPKTARGFGALNADTKLARAVYTVPTPQGTVAKIDAVIEEDGTYLRSPLLAGKLPAGKEWVKVKPHERSSEDSTPSEDPETTMQLLGASDSVHRSGRRRVRGVQTSRYVTNLDMQALAAKLRTEGEAELAETCEKIAPAAIGPVHAEAFVDGEGLLRRIRSRITTTADGTPQTVEMTMDLFDFESHPDVQLPPPSEVVDMMPFEEQQEALGQSS